MKTKAEALKNLMVKMYKVLPKFSRILSSRI